MLSLYVPILVLAALAAIFAGLSLRSPAAAAGSR